MEKAAAAAIQVKYHKINLKSLQFDQGDTFQGRGQYGDVKKAKWNGKAVAVKFFDSADRKGGFQQELVCLSLLQSHENIVIMHGACNCAKPFIVLEFAPLSLEKVLHEQKKSYWYNADHVMSWSLQTAVGLEYIHSKQMLHRDIKPSNILLFHHGRKLKLCDFGTARKLEHTLTDAVGTIRYMAPEVIQGKYYSDRCDVFSYGIVLWEMLTRHRPILSEMKGQHMPQMSIMFAMAKGDKPPKIPNLPTPIAQLIDKCFDYDPELRPSITEIRRKIEYLSKFTKTITPLIPHRQGKPKPVKQQSSTNSDVFVDDQQVPQSRVDADSAPGGAPPPPRRVEADSSINEQIPRAVHLEELGPQGEPIQRRDRTAKSMSISSSPDRPELKPQLSSPATESPSTYQRTPSKAAAEPQFGTLGRASGRSHLQEPEYEELEFISDELLSDKDLLQKQQEKYQMIEDIMKWTSKFPIAEPNSPYLIQGLEPELQPIVPNENNPQSMDLYRQYTSVCEEILRVRQEYSTLVEENMKLNKELNIDREKVVNQAGLNQDYERQQRLKENLLLELRSYELELANLRDEQIGTA